MSVTNKKDHADFQDPYRRSSNFGKTKDDTDKKPTGDGTLRPKKDPEKDIREIRRVVDELSEEDKEEE